MQPRIVFMGSPDFAIPSLQALTELFFVAGVVTQPDRYAGRGQKLVSPPVKNLALSLGISTIQPITIKKDKDAITQLNNWEADVIVVAAFGQILTKEILEIAPFGCINVHASLLPRWRGVSPIQAAILNGDTKSGVTIMKMDEGIDTGDILSQRSIPIHQEDTGGSLAEKLAALGGVLLAETIPAYLRGDINPQPQGESPTSYASMLKKSDGKLDFNKPAAYLVRQVQAYHPWPGTYTSWKNKPLIIHKARAIQSESPGIGVLTLHAGKPAIGTSEGILVIEEIQPAGKKSISGEAFLLGARTWGE